MHGRLYIWLFTFSVTRDFLYRRRQKHSPTKANVSNKVVKGDNVIENKINKIFCHLLAVVWSPQTPEKKYLHVYLYMS